MDFLQHGPHYGFSNKPRGGSCGVISDTNTVQFHVWGKTLYYARACGAVAMTIPPIVGEAQLVFFERNVDAALNLADFWVIRLNTGINNSDTDALAAQAATMKDGIWHSPTSFTSDRRAHRRRQRFLPLGILLQEHHRS